MAACVCQALCRSGKEEVLQHTVGTIYNLMTIEESRKTMVKEGVVALIFQVLLTLCPYNTTYPITTSLTPPPITPLITPVTCYLLPAISSWLRWAG